MLSTGALIAAMGIIGIAAASAQTVRVGPVALVRSRATSTLAAYAYSPGLRVEPSWEFSAALTRRAAPRAIGAARRRVRPSIPFLNRLVPDRC
jgi:hypothetical protein